MNKIITISREFGSGGRELGKRLAEKLGVAYYDKEIIADVAKRSGLDEKYVESVSERGIMPAYPITTGRALSFAGMFSGRSDNMQVDVLLQQNKILKELAAKGDCLIVGRCADVVLADYSPLNIFVYADMQSRIDRCMARQTDEEKAQNLTPEKLKKQIMQIDKGRANYRAVLSDLKWGDKAAYDICINTSGLEIKALIPAIAQYAGAYFNIKENN